MDTRQGVRPTLGGAREPGARRAFMERGEKKGQTTPQLHKKAFQHLGQALHDLPHLRFQDPEELHSPTPELFQTQGKRAFKKKEDG